MTTHALEKRGNCCQKNNMALVRQAWLHHIHCYVPINSLVLEDAGRVQIFLATTALKNSNSLHCVLPTRLRLSIEYMVGRRHSHVISIRQRNKPSY
jgi:hypothetical protein